MKKIIKEKKFKNKLNNNGKLLFIESRNVFKNNFKRFFSVSVPKPTTRGFHGHKKCTQILFCLNGKIEVYFKRKNYWKKYNLIKNTNYIIVPPYNFLKIKYCKSNSILGALCDRYYEKEDYYSK